MKILYKCKCMAQEREIDVTDRVASSDIADWMETIVTPALTYDHHNRNILCRTTAMEYVKIPFEEGNEIGVPASRN